MPGKNSEESAASAQDGNSQTRGDSLADASEEAVAEMKKPSEAGHAGTGDIG